MAVGLAACGSSSAAATAAATEAATAAAATASAAAADADATMAPDTSKTGNLVIYSPNDADPLNAAVALFESKYPNIKVTVVTGGTGELCQRIAAESANPQGDVLWGGGADTLAAYGDYFEPYVCANDQYIDDKFKDSKDHLWVGESPLPMVFLYNKKLIDEKDVPTTWEGLCDEKLKGKIAYASPAKSGSAYTQLCTMLFSQSSIDDGWTMVEKFIANLNGNIQDSSGNCYKLVVSGEYPIGVTLEKSAVKLSDNPDIGYVYPSKNSAVPDADAIIKGCPDEDNAKLLIDFATSKECQIEQNKDWARRPSRNDIEVEGLPKLSDLDIGDYDFSYAGTNKTDIVNKWNDLTTK
jgi:iron(III) transport system substrate-binding protein